jgi:predicted Zn-dependent protease
MTPIITVLLAVFLLAEVGTRADADALFQRGQYEEAGQIYLALLRDSPRDTGLLDAMGQTLRRVHQPRTAAAFFQREIALDPANRAAQRSLAATFEEGNAPEEAARVLAKLTSSDPADGESWYLSGMLSYQGGYYVAAIEQFDRALKTNGPYKNSAEIRRAVSLVEAGRTGEASEVLPKLLARPENANNLDLLLAYARLLYEDGRYDEAMKQAELATTASPANAAAHFWRARIFLQRNQVAEAIDEAERARELGPDSPAPRSLLVRLYQKAGRTAEAGRESAWLREREAHAANP